MNSSLQDKQHALFASLFRYAPEAMPLRQRILNRVVLAALVGSSEEEPMRIGTIERSIRENTKAPNLRNEAVQDTVHKLIDEGKVVRTNIRKVNVFYLSEAGIEETNKIAGSGSELLDSVVSKMIEGTDDLLPKDKAARICCAFIFECSSKFGRQMGQSVIGRWNGNDLVNSIDVKSLLNNITASEPLESDVFELIEAKCLQFLKSTDPNEETLKFRLTQTFYFCQLLGLDAGQFDPLAEHAFANSVFYMDTNVLFYGLIKHEESTKPFKELIKVCDRLKIELRVTRATIDEARRAAASRIAQLKQIDGNVPIELIQRTTDDFISSFYEAKAKDPEISVEGFFEQFENLPDTLTSYGIEIDDRNETEILGNRNFEREIEIIQQEVIAVRKNIKPEIVLAHDIAHYALVSDQRTVNSKTWFLTIDGSLLRSAIKLSDGQQPFCFSLPGFLQSISPFVSSDEETSLVEVFSTVLTEQIPTDENLFDGQELTVLAQMQEDILYSPPEKLAEAFEHMRRNALKGQHPKDTAVLALELKKYFVSSVTEKERTLGAAISRMGEETAAERKAREEAERKARETVAREESLRSEYEGLIASSSTVSQENIALATRLETTQHRQRLVTAVITFIIGIVIAIYQDSLAAIILGKWPRLLPDFVKWVIPFLGMLILVCPSVYCIRKTKQNEGIRIALAAIVLIIGLSLFKFLGDESVSLLASVIEVSVLIATVVVLFKFGNNAQEN